MATPESYLDAPLLVRGSVTDVCQHKGCWTVIRGEREQVRVRFADYGFFVPKDCRGKLAYVEGTLSVNTASAKELHHYASESEHGAAHEATDPERVVSFTATGVRLVDRERVPKS